MTSITADELKTLSQYIYTISGVSLDSSKAYLLETRLKSLVHQYACVSYGDLYNKSRADRSGEIEKAIIDAITTNETLFFRDSAPFEVFKHKILPDLIDARSRVCGGRPIPLRIWSAACSTGQEVYSIAISLRETLVNLSGFNISILGTDISDDAVSKASYGKYNKFEIERGMPMQTLNKYFTPTGDGWRIRDEIRSMAMFKKFNLMKPFTGLGKFDVVFCRNVAIYFTPSDKRAVFEKIAGVLESDGSLIIGSTESLTGVTSAFEAKRYLRSVFYQVSGGGGRPDIAAPVAQAPRPAVTRPVPAAPAPAGPARAAAARPVPPRPPAALSRTETNAATPPRPSPAARPAPLSTPPMPEPVADPIVPEPVSVVEPEPVFIPEPASRPAPVLKATGARQPAGDKSALRRLLMKKRQQATGSR